MMIIPSAFVSNCGVLLRPEAKLVDKAMTMNSKTAFKAALVELGLDCLHTKFVDKGWDSFGDFAFCTSDPTGKDGQIFTQEVIEVLLTMSDTEQAKLVPRLRRLYAQAYTVATQFMAEQANPQGTNERMVMNPADRAHRTQALRSNISGFTVSGPNLPANTLIDRFVTMLIKNIVKYVAWNKCVSRDQELLEEPEIKGLRITPEGLLQQDAVPDPTTDVTGEWLWDYALRRRAGAGDISGLINFATMDSWHETLKAYALKPAPPGHRRVSWAQLLAADKELFLRTGADCEFCTGIKPGELITEFEKSFKKQMFSPDVRQHLTFLPSSAGSPSSGGGTDSQQGPAQSQPGQVQKLINRLEITESQLRNLKRKLDGQPHRVQRRQQGRQQGRQQW